MAVRPAARGADNTTIGLIVMSILFVAGIGAFIWQLTANKEALDRAAKAEQRASEYGSPPGYYADEARQRRSSVFATMENDMKEIATWFTGKPDAVRPIIKDELDAALREASTATSGAVSPSDAALSALRRLTASYAQLKAAHDQLKRQLDDQQAENQTLADGNKAVRDEFDAQLAELRKEIEQLQQSTTESLAAKDKQVADQQASNDATTKELNDLRTAKFAADQEHELEVGRLNRRTSDLMAKLREVQPSSLDVNDILTKADGTIVRAIPGSDIVFISLGERDGVRPGLGFEVFSAGGERTVDYRGKARIEIVTVMQDACECKVTRFSRDKPIVEGDAVVNIAYERGRRTKFVVRGEFDLDNDGAADFDGMERVSAMIREFGGTVVQDVDESVDFVVLGTSPLAPSVTTGRPMSKVVEDLVAEKKRRGEDWTAVVDRAKTFSVPVLPQAQFLYLIGYGGTIPTARSQ